MHDFFQIVSLFLTSPTIILSLTVVIIWFRGAKTAFIKPCIDKTPMDWLLMGIWVGFFGSAIDNIYWVMVWTFYHKEQQSNLTMMLFEWGAFSNIFFRQICGTLAAYCHIKSYVDTKESQNLTKCLWVFSVIIGTLYVFYLS